MRLVSFSLWLLLPLSLSCHRASGPSLTRLEPSAVDVSELPREVTLVGKGLNRAATLSLMDEAPARVTVPVVWLDQRELELVEQPSSEQLVVKLPEGLSVGNHSVSVTVGTARAKLASSLRVTDRSSQSSETSPNDAGKNAALLDADSVTSVDGSIESGPSSNASNTSGVDSTLTRDASSRPDDAGDDTAKDTIDVTSVDTVDVTSDVTVEHPDASSLTTAFDAWVSVDARDGGADVDADNDGAVGRDASVENTTSETTSSTTSSTTSGGSSSETAHPGFRCAPGQFGSPEVVTVQGYLEQRLWSPTLSADGLTLYFTDGSQANGKLMRATRNNRGNTFAFAQPLPPLFPPGPVGTSYVTPDGLALYFYAIRPDGLGSRDIYVATRPSLNTDFRMPQMLGGVNSTNLDHMPWVSADELWLIWVSQRDGVASTWTATRPTKTSAFTGAQKITSLSYGGAQGRTYVTPDGLVAYFVNDERPGGKGADDIWYATRQSVSDEFSDITNVSLVNTAGEETDVTLTHDGEELFFVRTGNNNVLYRAVASCD